MDITVAIDCMGGDHGPHVTVPSALEYLRQDPEANIILVGIPDAIEAYTFLGERGCLLAWNAIPGWDALSLIALYVALVLTVVTGIDYVIRIQRLRARS